MRRFLLGFLENYQHVLAKWGIGKRERREKQRPPLTAEDVDALWKRKKAIQEYVTEGSMGAYVSLSSGCIVGEKGDQ